MKKIFVLLLILAALAFGGQTALAEKGWEIQPPETAEENRADPIAALFNFGAPPKNNLADIAENPLFKAILKLVETEYVDKNPNKEKMLNGAINGMLKSLDSHSAYHSPEEAKMIKEEMQGSFYGIGARLKKEKYGIVVVSIFEGSPAEKAGLRIGDEIIKIKDDSGELEITSSTDIETTVRKIRGAKGAKVVLTIMRENSPDKLKIEIIRDEIKIINITTKKIGKTGYIKLNVFTENSAEEMLQAVNNSINSDGAKNLILDLRGNGGGRLDAVIRIASMFLAKGQNIVSIKNRNEKTSPNLSSGKLSFFTEIPLVVLVDGGSASASEILAAAIKENKRGKIVGTTTYGKGSVQSAIPLSNGGLLRLTVAKFYSPLGNEIHDRGVEPDVEVKLEYGPNFKSGDPDKDLQLKKALEILNGKNK